MAATGLSAPRCPACRAIRAYLARKPFAFHRFMQRFVIVSVRSVELNANLDDESRMACFDIRHMDIAFFGYSHWFSTPGCVTVNFDD